MSDDPQRLGSGLDRVLRGWGAPEVDTIQLVFERWHEVVGEALAARTRPIRFSDDALVLAVDDSAVASHVRFLEPELLARISELLGPDRVRSLQVTVSRSWRS